VGGDHHGHPFGLEVPDDPEDLADEFGIERGGDLVQKHEARLRHQGPHDRHSLLLTAGEPVRVLVGPVEESEAVEQFPGLLLGLGAGNAMHLARAQGDVVDHPHVGEQIECLEHDAHRLANRVRIHTAVGDRHTVENDVTGVDRHEEVDALEQRGLARARGADEAHHLMGGDIQIDRAQHLLALEGLGDAA